MLVLRPAYADAARDEPGRDSALDQAYALGMRRTNLDGGEALAHRHVDEIVDRLVERGVG